MVSSEIYAQISRDYEKIRMENALLQKKRHKEIFEKYPEIQNLYESLSHMGADAARLVLENNNADEAIEDFKKRNKNILKIIHSKLMEYGYSENYLDDIHSCPVCRDKGIANDKRCRCFQQKFINYAYEMSKLGDTLKYENFDSFNLNFYSKEIDEKTKSSPYEVMKKIYRVCKGFTENFDKKGVNIYLCGKTGLGKTFLCNCIAKEMLDRGKLVVYVTAFKLFSALEKIKFNREVTPADRRMADFIFEADLLIIDDLGTEFRTVVTDSELFNIINIRNAERKKMVISSNLIPEDLSRNYSERIFSRIYDNFAVLNLLGDDIRLKRKGML